MKSTRALPFLVSTLLLCSCGGSRDNERSDFGYTLPLVEAPLDTTNVIVTSDDSAETPAGTGGAVRDPSWTRAAMPGYPSLAKLAFVRYVNAQLRYSIAYPDTLLIQAEPIGEGRGSEFRSRSGDVRMLVYGAEGSNRDDLEQQYRSTMGEPDSRVTYRAREEAWYVVSGRKGDEVFYEKSVLANGILRTFRIQYPVSKKPYFDGVTAMMSTSF